jgi:hypothetical protein
MIAKTRFCLAGPINSCSGWEFWLERFCVLGLALEKMGDFYLLWKGRASVVDELRKRLDEAAAAYETEKQSVIRIQKLFRGAFIRDKFAVQRAACIQITRLFRGHRSRLAFNQKVDELKQAESMAVYHYHAVVIQRAFRGFYSRRYYHDYRCAYV